ncbi:hypothetical protein RDABS01_031830 [Bienertia sinuspersici]
MSYSVVTIDTGFAGRSHDPRFESLVPDRGTNATQSRLVFRPKLAREQAYCMLVSVHCEWVLSSKEINFPYPLGLTLLHMVFSSILCFVLTKFLKILKVEDGMTMEV